MDIGLLLLTVALLCLGVSGFLQTVINQQQRKINRLLLQLVKMQQDQIDAIIEVFKKAGKY